MSMEQLTEFLDEQLVIIDSILASRCVPLHQRSLEASALFVQHCIVEISWGSLDNFLEEPWFGEIICLTRDWYVRRYGDQVLRSKPDRASGMALVFGSPFRLQIPITVARDGPNSETCAFHYPLGLMEDEQPIEWFEAPPNLAVLSDDEMCILRGEVTSISLLTRRLYINLMTAVSKRPEVAALTSGVRASFDSGVAEVCGMTAEGRRRAIWDLHFAVEKAVKSFILSRTESVQKIHDLRRLFNKAIRLGLPDPGDGIFTVFPSTSQVIEARYGKGAVPSIREIMDMYSSALSTALVCAEGLEHRSRPIGPGAVLYIRALPWAARVKERSEK